MKRNPKNVPVGAVIDDVTTTANSVMGEVVKVYITGEVAVYASQANEFMKSEFEAMVLALGIITVHSDGLCAIYPSMVNSVMALSCLGYSNDHPLLKPNLDAVMGLRCGHGDKAEI